MSSKVSSAVSLRCSRHPAVAANLRCDRCERPFCRDCLVTRFITSRSSVWLCRRCAGIQTAARYGPATGGGLIRHRGSTGGRGVQYLLVAGGFVALALFTALHQGLIH